MTDQARSAAKTTDSGANIESVANAATLRELEQEVAAIVQHFRERPVITAEDATEEDAKWITRYDIAKAKLARLGL